MKASHLILLGALFASTGAWAQSNPKNPDGTGTTANGSPSQVVGDTNATNTSNATNNANKPTGKMASKKHSKKQASRNASGTSTGGNGTHPNTGDAVNNPGMSGTGNNSGTDSSNMGNSGNTTSTPPGQQK